MAATENSLQPEPDATTVMTIPLDGDELQRVQQAHAWIQQVNENARAERQKLEETIMREMVIAQQQYNAFLYQATVKHQVDMGRYEFNLEQKGFVKK